MDISSVHLAGRIISVLNVLRNFQQFLATNFSGQFWLRAFAQNADAISLEERLTRKIFSGLYFLSLAPANYYREQQFVWTLLVLAPTHFLVCYPLTSTC